MSRIVDGLRIPTTLFEAAVWQHTIKVSCLACSNSAVFDPAGLWWWFERKHLADGLRTAHQVFYCMTCSPSRRRKVGAKPIELVRDEPTRSLPFPDDRVWKRALSRFKT